MTETPDESPLSPTERAVVDGLDDLGEAILGRNTVAADHAIDSIVRLVAAAPDAADIAEALALLMADEYQEAQSEDVEAAALHEYLSAGCRIGAALAAPAFGMFFLERATQPEVLDAAVRLDDARRALGLLESWSPELHARAAVLVASLLTLETVAPREALDEALRALAGANIEDPDLELEVASGVAASRSQVLLLRGDALESAHAARTGLAVVDRRGGAVDEALARAAAASHLLLLETFRSAVPSDAEAHEAIAVLRRVRKWVPREVLPPGRLDLMFAIAAMATSGPREVDEAFAQVESRLDDLVGADLAMLAVARAQRALLRGDIVTATARAGEAQPLVAAHGDEYVRSVFAGLVDTLDGIAKVAPDVGDAPLRVVAGMSPMEVGEQLKAARRRALSGRVQPTLSDELIALADAISVHEQPHLRLQALWMAAVVVPTKWASAPTSMREAVAHSDSILDKLEAALHESPTVPGPLAHPTRVFLAIARAINLAMTGQVGRALEHLTSTRRSEEVRESLFFTVVVVRAGMDIAELVGDRQQTLRHAVDLMDSMAGLRAGMTSARDRSRFEGYLRDAVRVAFDVAQAQPDVVAELIQTVRAQSMPQVPVAAAPAQTPLSVLVDLMDTTFGDEAFASGGVSSGALLGGAAQSVEEEWQVTLLGPPPLVVMPEGHVALGHFRDGSPRPRPGQVRLTILR